MYNKISIHLADSFKPFMKVKTIVVKSRIRFFFHCVSAFKRNSSNLLINPSLRLHVICRGPTRPLLYSCPFRSALRLVSSTFLPGRYSCPQTTVESGRRFLSHIGGSCSAGALFHMGHIPGKGQESAPHSLLSSFDSLFDRV